MDKHFLVLFIVRRVPHYLHTPRPLSIPLSSTYGWILFLHHTITRCIFTLCFYSLIFPLSFYAPYFPLSFYSPHLLFYSPPFTFILLISPLSFYFPFPFPSSFSLLFPFSSFLFFFHLLLFSLFSCHCLLVFTFTSAHQGKSVWVCILFLLSWCSYES